MVHWEKENMLKALNFKKGYATCPVVYIDFQFTKYSK